MAANPKAFLAGYWLATLLVAGIMILSGAADVLMVEPAREAFTHLGYPLYMGRMLGVFKTLGGLALLAPGFALLKEWAYAGIVFDLIGATVSHAASGDPPGQVAIPAVFLVLTFASYLLRPEPRRLAASPNLLPAPAPAP
ncbi:MAG: DoxX family protein [Planctomycetota bacterium]